MASGAADYRATAMSRGPGEGGSLVAAILATHGDGHAAGRRRSAFKLAGLIVVAALVGAACSAGSPPATSATAAPASAVATAAATQESTTPVAIRLTVVGAEGEQIAKTALAAW